MKQLTHGVCHDVFVNLKKNLKQLVAHIEEIIREG